MGEAIIKIPAELFALAESSHFEGTLELGTLAAGPDDYVFSDPVTWSVEVTNTGAAFLVSGSAQGTATVACSRCLEEVSMHLDGDIEGYFLVNGDEQAEYEDDGEDVGEDEFDVLPDDHRIDLEPLIRAALHIAAPQMPLCRQDCAGLCPVCGANLNDGDCGCGADEGVEAFDKASNPFAALADYKFDD